MPERRVAYIFEEPTGWFVCDAAAPTLDARGHCFPTKRDAIATHRELARQAKQAGLTHYTHYTTGGTNRTRKL